MHDGDHGRSGTFRNARSRAGDGVAVAGARCVPRPFPAARRALRHRALPGGRAGRAVHRARGRPGGDRAFCADSAPDDPSGRLQRRADAVLLYRSELAAGNQLLETHDRARPGNRSGAQQGRRPDRSRRSAVVRSRRGSRPGLRPRRGEHRRQDRGRGGDPAGPPGPLELGRRTSCRSSPVHVTFPAPVQRRRRHQLPPIPDVGSHAQRRPCRCEGHRFDDSVLGRRVRQPFPLQRRLPRHVWPHRQQPARRGHSRRRPGRSTGRNGPA